MADVNVTIRRDNGMAVSATGTVDDALVLEMTQTLAAILFDAATVAPAPAAPAPAAAPAPTP